MLKRRSEKLEPGRKLEGLNRKVLPPQCLRRAEGPLFVVNLVVLACGSSRVATADVVFVSETAESRVIAFPPQNRPSTSREHSRLIPYKDNRSREIASADLVKI
jgi:hypothetical protein